LACAGSQVDVPAWVQQVAAEPAGTYPPETKAVVLLDETTVSVNSPAEYIETHRRVVRILRPEGREAGEVAIDIRKDDKLLAVHAWSIDKDGKKYELKQKEFGEVTPYSFELYDDVRYYVGTIPASLPGSVIALESQVRRRAWRTDGHWVVQRDIPVKIAIQNLELPSGWEYTANWANREPVSPESLGGGRWRWTLRDIPAIAEDEHRLSDRAIAQSMTFAYYPAGNKAGTWAEIGSWSHQLAADRRVANPAISEKVRELTAGATDFDAKARALASFVQREVRYVAIEIGIGGWQPHAAPDVFRLRYGDCKDKATLLSTMLKEAGINSELVSIHTEHGVTQPNVPGRWFDHEILAIELPANVPADRYQSVVKTSSGSRYLIFDPTDTYTRLGSIRNDLQGNFVLLEFSTGGELLQVPKLDPETNLLVRTAKLKLGADGSLTGQVSEQRTGDHANDLRARFAHLTEAERVQWLERQAGRSLKQFTLAEPVFENLGASDKDVVIKYNLTTQNYGQASGPLLLVRNRILGPVSFRLPNKTRSYPVELGDITHIRDVVEIELPPGQVVDDMPFPVKLDVEFAAYQSQYEKTAGTVRYTRDYIVRDPHVPLDKLANLKKLENAIGQDEFASTVLKKQ
jgi:hypothetical protein